MKTKFLLLLLIYFGFFNSPTAQPQLDRELVASGLDSPTGIVNAGDERLFVIEQRGHVQIMDEEGNLLQTPFLDLSDVVSQSGFETGLLGLAFHPDYSEDGYFFINYTRETDGNTVVARFTVDPENPNQAIRESEVQMLIVEQPYANHNGGQLLFGPDGYLYIALGDGGDAGDPHDNGQDLTTMLGKMLRVDVNADNDSGYVVPPDNPFVGEEDALDEIWAYGLRNPWRNSFDRHTGDFWIADVGQNDFEEVNFQPSGSSGGENYGWRCYEGNASYNTEGCGDQENYVFPVFDYPHEGEGCSGSVTGGYVYRGALYNGMYGVYVFADFCTGNVYTITLASEGFEGELVENFGGNEITSFGEDQYGELYVVMQSSGEIHRLVEASDCNPVAMIAAEDTVLVIEPDSSIMLQAAFNPALDYQWYMNDESLAGEMQHELEVTEEGMYQVHVTNPENGCTAVSEALEVTSTPTSAGLKELGRVQVFPNPATDVLFIKGLPLYGGSYVNLFDSKGTAIYSKETGNQRKMKISITDFPPGMYYLQIIHDGEILKKKIMVSGHSF
ncbi:MAG: PQQ-dependent sugar dehydrogenase [Bacteroidota bacterium]